MTDTTTAPLIEAGDRLIDAVRQLTRGRTVDRDAIQAAIDNFIEHAGHPAEQLKPIQQATWDIVHAHKRGVEYQGFEAGPRMAAQNMPRLSGAIDDLAAPFERADDLAAAEQELAQRERNAKAALAELEQAVQAGDVDAVMKLRGEVEVKHPRKIAEARTTVLELQMERVRSGQDAARARVERARQIHREAEQRRADLLDQVKQAVEDATLAALEATRLSEAATERSSEVSNLAAELATLKNTHEAEMHARLRRIAGLPEPQQAGGEPARAREIGGVRQHSGADFSSQLIEVM